MKILSVIPKRNNRGLWYLIKTDQDGARKLATTNMLHAGLAQRAADTKVDVQVLTSSGWYYDDLRSITLTEPQP